MSYTTTLQSTQPKVKKEQIRGLFEDTVETLLGTGPGFTNESPFKGNLEYLKSLPEHKISTFSSTGEITGFQTPKQPEKSDRELLEEVRLEVAGMPKDDRNKRLHLNISLAEKHTNTAYHRAELYRQVKAEIKAVEQKEAPIPSPAKQPSALEGAFEGRSGTQGSGTANLSAHATG